jgi:tetratricopeptide (TPR) repeat protein
VSTILALLTLLLAAAPARAQTAKVTIDPPRLTVNEPGELSVEISQEGAATIDAAPPVVPSQADVSIRYIGPSTQVSIINGRATQRTEHRYAISAAKPGTYTIGPITVRQGGALKDVGSVRLEVLASGAVGGPTEGESAQLSLTLAVPRTEVYLHEHIPLTLALRVGQVRVADLQYPQIDGDGFSIEKLAEPSQRQEQVGGGIVQVVEFGTTLTPLRAGTLSVGPASMRLNVLQRDRRQDRFFGFFGETRRATELRGEPLTLTVLPLPDAGRPAGFSGAVGQFQWDVRATPLDPRAGDPVTVTTTIRGQGNLDTLTPPAITEGDALRVYPVQAATGNVPPGSRAFEQVVIPGSAGEVTLPPLAFSYFDPSARAYRTLTPAAIVLHVQPGVVARVETPAATPQPATGQAEAPLGQDIVFLKDSPGTLQPIGTRLYKSVTLWTFPLAPLAAWIGAVYWDRRRQEQADPRRARASRAGRDARAGIAAARQRLSAHDIPTFNDLIARTMSEYLQAKLDLSAGGVSGDAVAARLAGRPRARELADEVREFLGACERARYTPASASVADSERTLARATAIVDGLEKEKRLRSAIAALLLLAAGLGGTALAADPSASFVRAGGFYSEGRYADAARTYEEVRAAGVESANLYYNLGNAYFRAGDVGRAVLNYERARRLAPSDPDVLANLAFARSRGAEAEPRFLLSRILFPLVDRVSTDRLFLGAVIGWTALCVLLAVARLVPRARVGAGRGAILAAIVTAVFLTSGLARLVTVEWPPEAVVVSDRVATIRFEPSSSGAAHFEAKPGATLRLVTEREGWAQVERSDGRRGWVERASIEPL